MPRSSSVGSPQHTTTAASDDDYNQPLAFVHTTISGAGRLLPSSSHWNSIEIDFNILPQSQTPSGYESLPSRFSKSYDYNLIVTDKTHLKRCVYVTVSFFLVIALIFFLLHFVPLHKHHHQDSVKNLTLAVNQALVFFDAQKCKDKIPCFSVCVNYNIYGILISLNFLFQLGFFQKTI